MSVDESRIGQWGKLSKFNAMLHGQRIDRLMKRKRVWVESVNEILCEGLTSKNGKHERKDLTNLIDSLWAIPLDAYPTFIRAILGLVAKAERGELNAKILKNVTNQVKK